MSALPQCLLLDTNVWVENYIGERGKLTDSRKLIDFCLDHDIEMLVSIPSMKDVYYRIGAFLKGKERLEAGSISESFALAAKQIAWQSIRNLMDIATAVPMDFPDLCEACRFCELHTDFEDDLVLAAAIRAQADYLVTSDKKLIEKSIVPALSPTDMLTLMNSFVRESSWREA